MYVAQSTGTKTNRLSGQYDNSSTLLSDRTHKGNSNRLQQGQMENREGWNDPSLSWQRPFSYGVSIKTSYIWSVFVRRRDVVELTKRRNKFNFASVSFLHFRYVRRLFSDVYEKNAQSLRFEFLCGHINSMFNTRSWIDSIYYNIFIVEVRNIQWVSRKLLCYATREVICGYAKEDFFYYSVLQYLYCKLGDGCLKRFPVK